MSSAESRVENPVTMQYRAIQYPISPTLNGQLHYQHEHGLGLGRSHCVVQVIPRGPSLVGNLEPTRTPVLCYEARSATNPAIMFVTENDPIKVFTKDS